VYKTFVRVLSVSAAPGLDGEDVLLMSSKAEAIPMNVEEMDYVAE
jgi:hypothetical protein